jgi:hypothetical protein
MQEGEQDQRTCSMKRVLLFASGIVANPGAKNEQLFLLDHELTVPKQSPSRQTGLQDNQCLVTHGQ